MIPGDDDGEIRYLVMVRHLVLVMVRYLVGNEKNKVWLLVKSPVSQLLGCHVQLQHAFAKSEM